jgi:hypothetical protein
MSRDEKGDEVKDRLAGRFNSDESDESEASDKPNKSDTTDNQDNSDNPDNLNETGKPDNQIDPKEDWVGRMVYVPSADDDNVTVTGLLESFDGEYDRLQYECDWKIRKQLHYYPVVVQHGIETIEEMDGEDFTQAVSELGLPANQ